MKDPRIGVLNKEGVTWFYAYIGGYDDDCYVESKKLATIERRLAERDAKPGLSREASIAIRAARNFKSWGRYAAWRYCEKRGVSFSLYRLARVLEAAEGAFA